MDEEAATICSPPSRSPPPSENDNTSETSSYRLVRRNFPHYQSKNRLAIQNIYCSEGTRNSLLLQKWRTLFAKDMYHVLLRKPTAFTLLILISIWTALILIFALVYMLFDRFDSAKNCGLGNLGHPIGYAGAFAFSLETCTTVGYGLPNSTNGFFEPECGCLQFIIFLQMLGSMIFNAFFLAFLFARIARPEPRGAQLLFSNKAIVRRSSINSTWELCIRIFDTDASLGIVESNVRIYVMDWSKSDTAEQDVPISPVRISTPNDEVNNLLNTSMPCVSIHTIDTFSPLYPHDSDAVRKRCPYFVEDSGLMLREADAVAASRDNYECPICGETYGTLNRLRKHVEYNVFLEKESGVPREGSHQTIHITPEDCRPATPTKEQLRRKLQHLEIVCVVEGIDQLTAGSFQALQSYRLENIIIGDARFQHCVKMGKDGVIVDLENFHGVRYEKEQ